MEPTIITAIIGALATLSAALVTARVKDKTNAQLREEWGKYKNAVSEQDSYLEVDYGIKIISPAKDELLLNDIEEVRGVYSIMPPPETLRLYTVRPQRTAYGERFWPQEIVKEFYPDTKTWRARVNVGGLPDGGEIIAAILSQPAIVLWDYYYKVGPKIGWLDIEGWPNNSVMSDRVRVKRP